MIDLTNKSVDSINTLVQKYSRALELFTDKPNDIPYLAVVIDTGVNTIKSNYGNISVDWKCWTMVMLKELYYRKCIKSEQNIPNEIDKFITYLKENYQRYCDSVWSGSEYDRDRGFVYEYLKKRG